MFPKVALTPAAFPPNITLEKKPHLEQHQMLSQELPSSEVPPTNITLEQIPLHELHHMHS